MAKQWRNHPPTHMLVAAYMGWKAPETPTDASDASAGAVASPENENAAAALLSAMMAGGL